MNIRIGKVGVDEGEYIGRAFRGHGASPLANPFPVTDTLPRDRAIAWYRTWLHGKIKAHDEAVHKELGRLLALASRPEGVTLVCWCRSVNAAKPDCHGDVIRAALEWIAQDPVLAEAIKLGAVFVSLGL